MNIRYTHFKGSLYLLCSVLCWGMVPLFLRSFIQELDAWTANGFRYPFSALLWLIPFSIVCRKENVNKSLFKLTIIPAVLNTFSQALWAMVPYYLSPGPQAFFGQASVFFGIAGSFIVFQDELRLARSKLFWLGIAVCTAGFIGLNLLKGNFNGQITIIGMILILAQSVFMGLYGVSVRYYLQDIQPWLAFSVICFYTSTFLVTFMFCFGEPSRLLELEPHRFAILCISSVIGISFAHVFFYHSIMYIGVSVSNGCKLLMPFVTAAGSYWLFGEIFSWGQWLSGFMILLGAALLLLARQHLKQSE